MEWHADITPRPDRSLDVTETLTVIAEGDVIKRGITRSLPTRPHPLEVLSVTRDGAESPFHTRERGGELTIYAGEKDVTLSPGTYTYRIRYRLGRVVVQKDSLDELQFEVIGPDVALPVDSVSATVELPDGLSVAQYACYTGASGDSERNCTIAAPADGRLTFTGRGQFGDGEQLSVAAGFTPGYFNPPNDENTVQPPPPPTWWQREGSLLLWLLLSLGGVYYAYTTWRNHGVDPPAPRVGRVTAPPDGLSPASIGHLSSRFGMGAVQEFTASLLTLAIRGYLKIEEEEDKGLLTTSYHYVIRRTDSAPDPAGLPAEQRQLYRDLFAEDDTWRLKQSYDSRLSEVQMAHHKAVSEQHKELRSRGNNLRFFWPLVAVYAVSIWPAIVWGKHADYEFSMPVALICLIAGLVGVALYAWLIARPDPKLVRLRAEIEALRDYLNLSKSERKRTPNLPAMTEEHYEALLPYAIALGINDEWTGYFTRQTSGTYVYQPLWMVGGYHPARFEKSFYGAVNSGTTAPSASGGGGSVGGGAGGGGAGGW